MFGFFNCFLERVATCTVHLIRQGRTQAGDELPHMFQLVCGKPRFFVTRT